MGSPLVRTFLTVVILGALAAGGFGVYARLGRTVSATSGIPSFEVVRGPFEVSISSIGTLQAARSSVISAPFEGKVIKVLPEGSFVKKDEPVIWMETEDYEQELEDQQAQLRLDEKDLQASRDDAELEKTRNQYTLESEQTKVEISKRSLEDSRQKFESEKTLYERNISPQTKLDEARLALLQAELSYQNAQINLAKVQENLAANLRVKETEIEKAELRVEKTTRKVEEAQERIDSAAVRATTEGSLSLLKIWKSGTIGKVAEGDQIWRMTALAEIPDTSVMLANVPVNEIDISRVEKDQRAEVFLEAIPERSFPGIVEKRSIVPVSNPNWHPGATQDSGPREFEVEVRLNETNELFRPGMTASARIIVDELPDALQVPLDALFERNGERGVWIRSGDDTRFEPLKVLLSNDNFAAVEGNIEAGDQVLLADPEAGTAPEAAAASETTPPPQPGAGEPS
ncbi:hypothetical protein HZA57_05390 [Candidatus Poribacteria bacterium]|nr:hypothetical protein [Candidatus Poribacteria bacterium]